MISSQCLITGTDTFLLFSNDVDLRMIALDVPEINDVTLPLINLRGALAIDVDPESDSIFWTDVYGNTISTSKIDVRT